MLVTGCMFNNETLLPNQVVYTDAETRAIQKYQTLPIAVGVNIPITGINCAEPSPDIAKATENALSAALKVKDQGEASVSYSSAEAIAALVERTAAIQLLRDYMFRACEATANGMMTSTSYSLLMARTNKAMITLMLGETAAGAFGRSGVVLGGKSNSSTHTIMSGFAENFEEALENLRLVDDNISAVQEKLTQAETALATHNATKDDDRKDDHDAVTNSLNKAIDAHKAKLAEYEREKAIAMSTVQSRQEKNLEAAAEISTAEGFGSISAQSSAEIASVMREMQEIFIRDSLADEYISACITDMGMRDYAYQTEVPLENTGLLEDLYKISPKEFFGIKTGRTVLTNHCESWLRHFLDHAEKNRQSHLKRKDYNALARYKSDTVNGCMRLDTAAKRDACLTWAGVNIPQEVQKKKTKSLTDFTKLNELDILLKEVTETRLKDLEEASTLLSAMNHIPATGTDAATRRQELAAKTSGFINNSIPAIVNGKFEALDSTETHDALKSRIQTYLGTASLTLQSQPSDIDRRKLELEYDPLVFNIDLRIQELTELKTEIGSLISEIMTFEQANPPPRTTQADAQSTTDGS